MTDPSWVDDASASASTPEGHRRLSDEAELAHITGDLDREAELREAILRGETLRALNIEVARLKQAKRGRTLSSAELDQVKVEFGVDDEQVRRDHAISHMLAALSRMPHTDQIIFFGGTALSRTLLPALRLSEDIDLITRAPRTKLAGEMATAIARGLSRSHGAITWDPPLTATNGSEPAVVRAGDLAQVRIQLLTADGYPPWPTERKQLVQRYSDAPPALLTTLTPAGFVASKTAAWFDRQAPRDLYDLWALGAHGYLNAEANALFARHGPTARAVDPSIFRTPPTDDAWHAALAHQGRIHVTATQALTEVRKMWANANE